MVEPKPLASLTSGLLARKGAASPAMRRPVFGLTAGATALQEDLGWNDMGFDVTQPEPAPSEARSVAGLTPMTAVPAVAPVPAVVTEREELAERIAETAAPAKVEKTRKKARASAAAKGRKAAFTLRLDADRHLKLRLASAIVGRSAQQMLTEALDAYLASLPEVDRLARELPRAATTRDR
ncbi:hypothetical protein Sj15T_05070 [Sphingobium sp. TA15]|uniref:Uncharacterized protein n=1 Tax=Sphingobium indicum (strain DSM 16413 / CCM 7287 / MTCC 6362 / UT26 / NBRC 101211 / UT26S) TaxID=452662 RepID=D4Z0Q2_SPHIU|nr:hypothetical protein [Sphingobium indicum]BAI96184.1 hypothetical protein SJA_C1-13500 [Sphingobium indicum UT26S]BDD65486.1 hypothetical protein Sj15T_05070 [Sphingobium sp. TA15]